MSSHPIAGGSGELVKADLPSVIGDALGHEPAVRATETVDRVDRKQRALEAAETRQRRADAVDLALFEQVALERSEVAFSELYDRYAPRLYAMMLHYVRVEEDALDLLQDTFILLWEKAPLLYREKTHARAAIYHFARNCAIDAIRSRRRRKDRFEPLPDDQPTLDDLLRDERTPETNLNSKEARQHMREALLTLSDMQRMAIDLAYFGGLTHAEIATRLGVTDGAVSKAIHSAIRKLAKVLVPRFEEPNALAKMQPIATERVPASALRKSQISIIPYGHD